MTENQNPLSGPTDCVGSNCDWVGTGRGVQCVDGTGGCQSPLFLEAEESSFHPKELQDATKKINRILAKLPAAPRGRKLSVCETHHGPFLAYVQHGKPLKGEGVTRNDDDDKVAKALKLKRGKKKS